MALTFHEWLLELSIKDSVIFYGSGFTPKLFVLFTKIFTVKLKCFVSATRNGFVV